MKFIEQFKDPLIMLLLGSAIVSLVGYFLLFCSSLVTQACDSCLASVKTQSLLHWLSLLLSQWGLCKSIARIRPSKVLHTF